ncbi:MAG TPA: hypothetical protein VF937_18295 [Chloroflexota bacterium]
MTAQRRALAREARRIWAATANPDGTGLLERGREYQPSAPDDFDPLVVDALVRLARLAESIAEKLGECSDATVRRSAAVLAARSHPIRVALDA